MAPAPPEKRLVRTENAAHFLNFLRTRIFPEHRQGGVSRSKTEQHESKDQDTPHDQQGIQNSFQCISKHFTDLPFIMLQTSDKDVKFIP